MTQGTDEAGLGTVTSTGTSRAAGLPATTQRLSSSFRDPSGFVFRADGRVYRQINQAYQPDYDLLMSSGLYQKLVDKQLMVSHEDAGPALAPAPSSMYKVILPQQVPFISYPYEWSFAQWKDAALLTLEVQQIALEHQMTLKDASAYNIQFVGTRPVFIDTLSFARFEEGQPWVAYRQFCQHFLAPLALMAHCDWRLGQLMRVHIDGIPLDLASRLLPGRTKMNVGLLSHIHVHSRSQKKYADRTETGTRPRISRVGTLAILDSLASTVRKLRLAVSDTEWADYYSATNYSDSSFESKKALVQSFLDEASPSSVWDIGANTGLFSRLASDRGIPTVAWDIDPLAVQAGYEMASAQDAENILNLMLDLTNPSPGIGWAGAERDSWLARGPVDLVMALALVHHLAISNNVPLQDVADLMSKCAQWCIIEFVPKSDSQVKRLLATREDVFPNYTREGFEAAFDNLFSILRCEQVGESERTLYLMRRR